jgi:hypothetical protein
MENKQELNQKREIGTKYRYSNDFPVTCTNDSTVCVFIILVKSPLICSNKLKIIKSLLALALS